MSKKFKGKEYKLLQNFLKQAFDGPCIGEPLPQLRVETTDDDPSLGEIYSTKGERNLQESSIGPETSL